MLLAILFGAGRLLVYAQGDGSRLRVVNAALALPEADIYVGETLYFEDVVYGYISPYVPVDPGQRKLQVRPRGVNSISPVIERGDVNIEANRDFTAIILDVTGDQFLIIRDDNETPLEPGQARVQILHVSRTTPAVEVCLDNRCQNLTYKGRSNFGNYPNSEEVNHYTTLDAGTYNLVIRFTGLDKLQVFKQPISFAAGQVYSLFIFDAKQIGGKPHLALHSDTGQALPHYTEDYAVPHSPGQPAMPGVGGPGGGAAPPVYPPLTGAFLSPTALVWVSVLGTLIVVSGVWLVKQKRSNV